MIEKKLNWGLISSYRQEIMGVACLWVILHHNSFQWPEVLKPLKLLFAYGNCGVDIFLFLSGVSLYFAFQRKQKLSVFYFRRFFRLVIPYLLIATPYWVWRDIYLQKGDFLRDITMASFPLDGNIATWYIGAIAVFYLAYPLIYKILYGNIQLGNWNIPYETKAILLPTFMAGVCLVVMQLFPELYDHIEIALTRSVVFLIGCAMGRFVFEKKECSVGVIWSAVVFLVFYFFAFRPMVKLPEYWIRMSYVPMAVSVLWIVATFIHFVRLPKVYSVLRYFGSRSVEIYLTHVLINHVYFYYHSVPVLDKRRVLDYCIVIAISLVISEFVHFISGLLNSKKNLCLRMERGSK